jgi:hypothetical protein
MSRCVVGFGGGRRVLRAGEGSEPADQTARQVRRDAPRPSSRCSHSANSRDSTRSTSSPPHHTTPSSDSAAPSVPVVLARPSHASLRGAVVSVVIVFEEVVMLRGRPRRRKWKREKNGGEGRASSRVRCSSGSKNVVEDHGATRAVDRTPSAEEGRNVHGKQGRGGLCEEDMETAESSPEAAESFEYQSEAWLEALAGGERGGEGQVEGESSLDGFFSLHILLIACTVPWDRYSCSTAHPHYLVSLLVLFSLFLVVWLMNSSQIAVLILDALECMRQPSDTMMEDVEARSVVANGLEDGCEREGADLARDGLVCASIFLPTARQSVPTYCYRRAVSFPSPNEHEEAGSTVLSSTFVRFRFPPLLLFRLISLLHSPFYRLSSSTTSSSSPTKLHSPPLPSSLPPFLPFLAHIFTILCTSSYKPTLSAKHGSSGLTALSTLSTPSTRNLISPASFAPLSSRSSYKPDLLHLGTRTKRQACAKLPCSAKLLNLAASGSPKTSSFLSFLTSPPSPLSLSTVTLVPASRRSGTASPSFLPSQASPFSTTPGPVVERVSVGRLTLTSPLYLSSRRTHHCRYLSRSSRMETRSGCRGGAKGEESSWRLSRIRRSACTFHSIAYNSQLRERYCGPESG